MSTAELLASSGDPDSPSVDDETLAALEAISPSRFPCILRLSGGRCVRALRRNGPVWILDHEIGEVAVRTETLLPLFEGVEPWRDEPVPGEIGLAEPFDADRPAGPAPTDRQGQADGDAKKPEPEPEPPTPAAERRARVALDPDEPEPEEDPSAFIRRIVPSHRPLRQVFGRLARGGRAGLLVQLSVAAAISSLLGFALPLFTMAIYDRVVPHNAQTTLIALTSGIVLVMAIDLVLRFVRARLSDAIGLGVNLEMQAALYARLTRTELAGAQRGSGSLTAAFQSVEALALAMPALVVGLFIDLPFVALTLLYISIIGGWVVAGPLCAIGAIVLVGLIAHVASRGPTRSAAMFSAQRLGVIDETAAAMEQVKTLGAAGIFDRIWLRLVDGAGYHGHRSRMSAAYAQQTTAIVAQGATVATLVIGVGLIAGGEMTMGALVACSILVGRTIQPVTAVMAGLLRVAAVAENTEAAKALAEADQERAGDDTAVHAHLSGAIEIRNLSFAYPGGPTPVLKDISLSIEPGERIVVIGRIGCGKSTLARMIPRLFTAQEGAVYLDGRDIRQFDPDRLRAQVGYMAQDLDLFDDTVFENIRVGLPRVTDEAFSAAVHASGVHDFISRRAEGYGLRVGPRGRKLSGGERQAVTLARALVRDAPILVLDEPTAAMDNQLERTLIERLRPVVEGRTLILATHRAPALALATRVVWLEDGAVVADGPPSEILDKVVSRSA